MQKKYGVRNYTKGFREDMENKKWQKLTLVEYYFDNDKGDIVYKKINE